MMKLTNTKDHTNVIIVSRAYVNGNLIVCDSGDDVFDVWADCWKLESLPEQPVSDHLEIEVEFRGEKVTISREFYRDGEMNYSTSEQDDNAIWSALRAWFEKKGITPFELYPKQPEQPVKGLEEAAEAHTFFAANQPGQEWETHDVTDAFKAGAEWMKSKYEK